MTFRIIGKRFNGTWARLAKCYSKAGEKIPDKLDLLTEEQRQIRCGVLLPSLRSERGSAFLSSLLADVYSTDQYWFNVFVTRHSNPMINLIKYGPAFDLQTTDKVRTFTLPSPWLQDHNVQFLESELLEASGDGAHVYLDLKPNPIVTSWPSLHISDKASVSAMVNNEVDSEMALEGIRGFIKDKTTVKQYLESLERSNFLAVSKELASKLDKRAQIFDQLGKAVIQNIYKTDPTIVQFEKLQRIQGSAEKMVDQWSHEAHKELQSTLKPLLESFAKYQLSVFKIYGMSENKLQLKLRELCDLAQSPRVADRLNHIRGTLTLPYYIPDLQEGKRVSEQIHGLHKEINKTIYREFFTLQLPLIVCAVLGIISDQFSVYSMGSLAGLGIVLGTRRVMNRWSSLLSHFIEEVVEHARIKIENQKHVLKEEWSEKFLRGNDFCKTKIELLKDLRK